MNIKKVTTWTIILLLVIIIIPTLFYCWKFKDFVLSDQPADWGTFGDYIGGVVGTCFSLMATILALVSIYISLGIAEKVQENEIKFNTDNSKREIEKFEIEKDLLIKQYKPFPHPNFLRYKELTFIAIENHGAGPMMVKNIKISYNSKIYSNFYELPKAGLFNISSDTYYYYNSAPTHSLIPGGSRTLLEVKPKKEATDDFFITHSNIREVLKDCELNFDYEDIFETTKHFKIKLAFFKI